LSDSHTKASILLQSHFSRRELNRELACDLDEILDKSTRLLQAMVDVLSSSGWLSPALAAMELCQMCVQGVWDRDPMLLQLPHFSSELARKMAAAGVEAVFDLMEMEDQERKSLLGMSPVQLADVARVCNCYPNVEVTFELEDADEVAAGDSVTVVVLLERDATAVPKVPTVHAPRFPKVKEEGWWLIIGDSKNNSLLCIKRIALQLKAKVKLEFIAPECGEYLYTLYLMSDSYLGCDQELALPLTVGEAAEDDDGEESDES